MATSLAEQMQIPQQPMATPPTPIEIARALMQRKDEIDSHLQFHATQLADEGVTMDSPLVDAEGFPRPDVDIYRVRNSRKSIIELRNDRNLVMEQLANVLQLVYDPSVTQPNPPVTGIVVRHGKPFAKVDGVSPGSPAAEAGLLREDLIFQFDNLTQSSFRTSSLRALVDVVNDNENKSILLRVLRQGEGMTLTLVPKRWSGRGLLGCHIVPYSPP
ncbi:Nas2-N domain-containing protein [Mycena indigotica]|uniref:Probable 26S proteasome regulatory subunit p27 n=1 Tax=Mycena indigotica TaxID=2126181 RepID=A0A8H6W4H1_9AGAR|nr:Nas2-N domain-containing protein [Mycena indigotica]KAF7298944.1 Nas2-N domain-containing protein [Mycena indigotica]